MARVSPFVVKFFIVLLLVLGGIAFGAFKFYGNVLTKGFYYKFSDSELLGKLDGAEMDRAGADVKIAFPEKDSVWHFAYYNKKNPSKSKFTLLDYSGAEIAVDQPFSELPTYLKQLFGRLGETGVRRIRSVDGTMVFNIADRHRLIHMPQGGVEALAVLPMTENADNVKVLDDHWYAFRLKP